jgi:hypothetical protein
MELLWVAFNLLGIEQTTTDPTVRSVSDIHLAFMPYSHSVAMSLGFAALAWFVIGLLFGRAKLGFAVALGITSHLLLDLLTHARDIAVAPGFENLKFGLGLYAAIPLGAFVLELLYGILCWWVYKGNKALLAIIILFNFANLSLLSPAVPGPESLLAGRPIALVLVIFAQIVVTLFLVGFFAVRQGERGS